MNTPAKLVGEIPSLFWHCIQTHGGKVEYIKEQSHKSRKGCKYWKQPEKKHIAHLLFVNRVDRPRLKEIVMETYGATHSSADTIISRIALGKISVTGYEQYQGR